MLEGKPSYEFDIFMDWLCGVCSPGLHVPGGVRCMGLEIITGSGGTAGQEGGSGRNWNSRRGTLATQPWLCSGLGSSDPLKPLPPVLHLTLPPAPLFNSV